MAIAFFAELNNVDICECPLLLENEKETIIQHLIFSSNIKYLWKKGDAIIEAIFNRKRKRRRLLYDKTIRRIVRLIRRLAKYEVLRSCLEGLLFDEIENEDNFIIKGLNNSEIMSLTQIYFATNIWDQSIYDYKELEFEDSENVTSLDYLKILHFFNEIEMVLNQIVEYASLHKERASRWRQRVMRAVKHARPMSKKSQIFNTNLIA